MTTGFSFDFLGNNEAFNPAPVARTGAASPADCLSSFAQIADSAWYMGGNATMEDVSSATSFELCTAACTTDCMYVTYDYDTTGTKCSIKRAGTGSE